MWSMKGGTPRADSGGAVGRRDESSSEQTDYTGASLDRRMFLSLTKKESELKKYLLTTASLLAVVSLMGVAQLGTAVAKQGKTTHASAHVRHALSEASARTLIRTGKLKPVTAKQAAKLNARVKTKLNARVKSGKTMARTSQVGGNYFGRYQEQGRLWYDETYDFGYSSSNYYYYYYYKNWLVCSSDYSSSGYCLDANSYDYYYYIYYYGTWYYGGWYGPYSG
jgi:hypothetical protein